MNKIERLDHSNQLIKLISDHGRRFFYNKKYDRVARLEIGKSGHVFFRDDYTDKLVYTHYTGMWRDFSHGGTMRRLIELMRDYVIHGKKISIWRLGPRWHPGGEDIWGYGSDAVTELRNKATEIPIIKAQEG